MKGFIDKIHKSLNDNELIEIKLINPKDKSLEFKQLIIKPIILSNGPQLSFVYRYPTKDITKNYNHTKSILKIKDHLKNDFSQAIALTANNDIHFSIFPNGKTSIKNTKPSKVKPSSLSHDKEKSRLISVENNTYLASLGVSSSNGLIKAKMQGKYRQINKFIEIVDSFRKDLTKLEKIKAADMGAGKGYLSFALYDYLTNTLNKETNLEAIELRENLVSLGNEIAAKSNFQGLKFIKNDIQSFNAEKLDLLIALHACDTATDDAIQKGINAKAKLIICSPCCHKQIRKEMNANSAVSPILQFGILKERQAEIVTDTIRALILQYYGYRTNVMEFISTEHTSKNLLITAIQDKKMDFKSEAIKNKIVELKSLYGIKQHYLESLLLMDC